MRRLLFFLIMPLHYLFGMFLLPFVYLIGKFDMNRRIALAYWYNNLTGWWLYTIAGAKITVKGLENIPADTNVLFVGNHKSMLDIPLLMRFNKKPVLFVAKKGVLKYPVLGWWIHASGALLLDRDDVRQGITTILQGIDYLKQGRNVAIFPEGTRSKSDAFLPFKQGSMKLASKSGVPIVPVAIKGTADVFENNHINLAPEKVYITFGEPVMINDLPKELQSKSADYLSELIRKMYDEMPS